MRRHKQHVVYDSILPVLHEPGCSCCRLLKENQADRLQTHERRFPESMARWRGYRQQLSADIEHLRELLPESDRIGWGAVGRAAEFLVSQRGLRP